MLSDQNMQLMIKSIQDLENIKKDHEKRITQLEHTKIENTETIKNITCLMEQQNKNIEKMSEEIKLLVLKPLQTYEKVKLSVIVALATAVVIAWANGN